MKKIWNPETRDNQIEDEDVTMEGEKKILHSACLLEQL